MARDSWAHGGSGPRPRLPPTFGQPLCKSDGEAPVLLGRREVREPGRRVLRHCPFGPMGSRLPPPRPGRARPKRSRDRLRHSRRPRPEDVRDGG